MCRVLAYCGKPVIVDELLYQPNSSLIRQSYDPQQLHMLNLGGFGLIAWDPTSHRPGHPFIYRSTELPVFDPNLKSLSQKIRATCLLAHVRGIAYRHDAGFGPHNLHPFHYDGFAWAMAHNGDLAGYRDFKHALLPHIEPEIARRIAGTTDSEGIYALVMSRLRDVTDPDPEPLVDALFEAITILRQIRAEHGVAQSSSMNLFFTNGHGLVALRFTFDFGCYATDEPGRVHEANLRYLSLWFTAGEHYRVNDAGEWTMVGDPARADSVLIASEPLTRDVSGWVEIPEYTVLVVDDREAIQIRTYDVHV